MIFGISMQNTKTADSLINAKILVIGLGISGRAAAGFLLRRSARVTGVDQNPNLLRDNSDIAILQKKGMIALHISEKININEFDLVVVSPGIPQSDALYVRARQEGIEVIGEVELACRFLNNTVLGVTGTNGKTTVTLLVNHILNHSGIHAAALGNSGIALTSEEAEREVLSDSVVVVELSSYQLETMQSKVLDAAVILNITPDHLDRYSSMEAYAASKMHMHHCMKSEENLYIEHSCFQKFGYLLSNKKVNTFGYDPRCELYCDLKQIYFSGKPVCDLPVQLKGKATHEVENFVAAFALCHYMKVSPQKFFEGYSSFKKPAHRIEFVREINRISYFDDSKGTNLDAVIKAVNVMNGDVILIAGGVDKGAAYTPWIKAFANKVKCICAIGQAAEKIENDLSHAIPVRLFGNLQEAVLFASKLAQSGDNILLSPGCSSFDMFRDYAHRGEEFQRLVKSL